MSNEDDTIRCLRRIPFRDLLLRIGEFARQMGNSSFHEVLDESNWTYDEYLTELNLRCGQKKILYVD